MPDSITPEARVTYYKVNYEDPETGYAWTASFASEAEATDQAVADLEVYGGVAPQEIVDPTGTTVVTQQEIIAAAGQ